MSIEWALSHTVHYGNELADKLAKNRSITQTAKLEVGQPPTPHAHLKRKIFGHILNEHKKWWSNYNISNNTKELVSAILNRNLQGQHLFNLGFDVLIPLVRQNNLNHFQNKIDYTTAPYCSLCEKNVNETVLHLICDWEYFAFTHMSKFNQDPITNDQLMRFISLSKKKDLLILLDSVGDHDV